MKKLYPRLLGLDVISTPKLIGLSSFQSSYQIDVLSVDDSYRFSEPLAVALPDTVLMQSRHFDKQCPETLQSHTVVDCRKVADGEWVVTSVRSETVKALFCSNYSSWIRIVDTESACVERCLQKIFNVFQSSYKILLIDQNELRFYELQEGVVQFKYRDLIEENLATVIRRWFEIIKPVVPLMGKDPLYVAGNHFQLNDSLKIIKQDLSIPNVLINPFEKLIFASEFNMENWSALGPAFVVACGLALRENENE